MEFQTGCKVPLDITHSVHRPAVNNLEQMVDQPTPVSYHGLEEYLQTS
jgi:hypothetical protein